MGYENNTSTKHLQLYISAYIALVYLIVIS